MAEGVCSYRQAVRFQTWFNVARRRRRWANIKLTLGQSIVFAGKTVGLTMEHSADVGLMLNRCHRRWADIRPPSCQCLMFIENQTTANQNFKEVQYTHICFIYSACCQLEESVITSHGRLRGLK